MQLTGIPVTPGASSVGFGVKKLWRFDGGLGRDVRKRPSRSPKITYRGGATLEYKELRPGQSIRTAAPTTKVTIEPLSAGDTVRITSVRNPVNVVVIEGKPGAFKLQRGNFRGSANSEGAELLKMALAQIPKSRFQFGKNKEDKC